MKDLIKKLNIYECEYETNSLGIIFLKDCYLKEDIDNIINQHNIITAPKQIKLSEVLDKIDYDDIQIKRDNHLIFVKNSNGLLFTIDFNRLLPNRILDYVCYGNLKWLYTLWIAGTTIIDDLEDKE